MQLRYYRTIEGNNTTIQQWQERKNRSQPDLNNNGNSNNNNNNNNNNSTARWGVGVTRLHPLCRGDAACDCICIYIYVYTWV